jgi:hypothetical protein
MNELNNHDTQVDAIKEQNAPILREFQKVA